MGDRRAGLIVVLFCFCLLVSTLGIAFASSENWVEVVRFEGSEDIQTEPFTCNYIEWQIKWNSSPDYQHRGGGKTLFGIFSVRVFEHITEKFVTSFGSGVSNESDNGTFSFNEDGTFYLEIDAFRINEYSIIVEQNIDSIPEFPSWIILPIVFAATLAVAIYRKRMKNRVKF